ncbi:MAG: DUF4388 domain-containing protein [Acidobacteria bacterium]|nr:MAG: DUF4388 domain-containing protein [Acidobacteriota bacterium]
MEDKERGSLDQKTALELILELYHGGVTGSLKLERTPLQKAVYFRDGQILFAASNDPKDQLASILVEEGKLGPDQMQVAQARVSSGNPLAKVLTELGYISQRELADAARVKVERILTDLYTWDEGTFEFATKSLPKGAIDLDLSTPHLIAASIRRIQDRDWVLKELGSLETALTPNEILDTFINETKADAQTIEVLRHADGTKTVQQIASLSSLGEFEVCKILAAAVVVGAMTKGASIATSDDAFAFPTEEPEPATPSHPVFSSSPSLESPDPGALETVGLPTPPPPEKTKDDILEAPDDTVFEPPPDLEKTVFESPPAIKSPANEPPSANEPEPMSPAASELIIDDPEPDNEDDSSRRGPPRPKGHRGGSAPSRDLSGILKVASVVALAAAAAFSVYYFVLPLVMGGSEATGAQAGTQSTVPTTSPPPSATPPPSPAAADPRAGTADPTGDPRATTPPPAATSPPPPAPSPPPTQPKGAPPPPSTTTAPRTPPPPTRTGSPSSGNARQQLAARNLNGAARSFLAQLRASSAKKFTIALGLYCDEDNVGRIVTSASGSEQIFILPTTVQGRSCYRIIWGLFDTRQAANSGMGSLPSGIRAGDAAAVPLSRLLR